MLVILLMVIIIYGREKEILKLIRHKRNFKRILVFVAISTIPLIFKYFNIINLQSFLVVIGTLIIYFIYYLRSLRPLFNGGIRNRILRKLNEQILLGKDSILNIVQADCLKLFFQTTTSKIEYMFLKINCLAQRGEALQALNLLTELDDKLYPCEKKEADITKAKLLVQLGNLNAAKETIPEKLVEDLKDSRVYLLYRKIYYEFGNLKKSYKYIVKAKALIESKKTSASEKVEINFYYGLFTYYVSNNRNERIRSYRYSWEIIKKQFNNTLIVFKIAERLSLALLQDGYYEEAETVISDLSKIIRPLYSIFNYINLMNTITVYYRQLKNENKIFETYKTAYENLFPQLSKKEKILLTVSTFRMVMNGRFNYEWLLENISNNVKDFEILTTYERFKVIHEYWGILNQETFAPLLKETNFKGLYDSISNYYAGDALSDIDKLLSSIDPCEVYKYAELMNIKISILKHKDKQAFINKNINLFHDYADTLYKAGLNLTAINNVEMLLLDECTAPCNIITKTFYGENICYQELKRKYIIPCSFAIPTPDKIHILYYIPVHKENMYSPYKDIIISQSHKISRIIDSWGRIPEKVSISIELAKIYFEIGDIENAKKHWNFFKSLNLSPNHFANWMQQYISFLEEHLDKNENAS